MLSFALEVITPVAVCVTAGWILGKYRGISSHAPARMVVDVFGPALLLSNIPKGLAAHWQIAVILLASTAGIMSLAALYAKATNIRDRDHIVGLLLGATLCNFGFFGLPVVESALGRDALGAAVTVMVILNIPTGFLSAYFSSPKPDISRALRFTFSTPFNWAVIATIILGIGSWELPALLDRPMSLLGYAAVPTGLLVLGIDLSKIKLTSVPVAILATALSLRLILAPVLVAILTLLVGLTGDKLLAQSAVLQFATPAGITPLIFMASEGRDTRVLAAIVFWSTLLSLVTIPIVAILITS